MSNDKSKNYALHIELIIYIEFLNNLLGIYLFIQSKFQYLLKIYCCWVNLTLEGRVAKMRPLSISHSWLPPRVRVSVSVGRFTNPWWKTSFWYPNPHEVRDRLEYRISNLERHYNCQIASMREDVRSIR